MQNIKFSYLYRDAGNYKQFGHVIFSNPNNIDIDYIGHNLKANLIDEEYFFADTLNIPPLFFYQTNADDHLWHEFQNIEVTIEKADMKITIEDFLHLLKARQLN